MTSDTVIPGKVSRIVADIMAGRIADDPLPQLTREQGERLRAQLLQEIKWNIKWGEVKDGPAGTIILRARIAESLRNEEIRLARVEKADRETVHVFTSDGGGGMRDFSLICADRTPVAVSDLSDKSMMKVYEIIGNIMERRGILPAAENPNDAPTGSSPGTAISISSGESSSIVDEEISASASESALQPKAKLSKAEAHIANLQTSVKTVHRNSHQPRSQLPYHMLLLFICSLPWTFSYLSSWVSSLPEASQELGGAAKDYGSQALWAFLNFLGFCAESYVSWLRGGAEAVPTPSLMYENGNPFGGVT